MSYATMNPKHYDYLMKKIRGYFEEQGLTECYLMDSPAIMSACEEHTSIVPYYLGGTKYPLNQTTQMALEHLYMTEKNFTDNKYNGYYGMCNSVRWEVNPVQGRHSSTGIFPLLECEAGWDQREMINFQKGLLRAIGIKPFQGDDFVEIEYKDACLKYQVEEIGHEEEKKLCKDFNSPAVFLTNFTLNSNPFWNMKKVDDYVLKVDVIIGHPDFSPKEIIGSSERSTNVQEMRDMFHTVSNGDYCKKLYEEFGFERVEKELEEYLALPFRQRSGMGIGMTRLVYACQTLGIFDHLDQ